MAFDPASLRDFATSYTAARCSQSASIVAALYSLQGSLFVNGGTPALGRKVNTNTRPDGLGTRCASAASICGALGRTD
jgi:hypothetical protein